MIQFKATNVLQIDIPSVLKSIKTHEIYCVWIFLDWDNPDLFIKQITLRTYAK
ncbi:MAG: hypothetical protein RLZZ414_516 [Bacteroidota bacterium]|jgi:hypothetical protein